MKAVGDVYENRACDFLRALGYAIVATNYKAYDGKCVGEIDIIAQEGNTLVAVEVKARASRAFGGALQTLTPSKQQKIIRTMEAFLQDERYGAYAKLDVRFDVIGFDGEQCEHICGAFVVN